MSKKRKRQLERMREELEDMSKKDLQKNAHVSVEEADAYAASVGAQHIRTSAKLDQGVDEVFFALVQSESSHQFCVQCVVLSRRVYSVLCA